MKRLSHHQKLAFVLVCLLIPVSVFGQSEWGNITGVVTDPSGANLNSNQFGIVTTQVNDPRQMQVGLKIYW